MGRDDRGTAAVALFNGGEVASAGVLPQGLRGKALARAAGVGDENALMRADTAVLSERQYLILAQTARCGVADFFDRSGALLDLATFSRALSLRFSR